MWASIASVISLIISPGVRGHDRRSQYLVGAFPDMDLDEPCFLAIDHGPVGIVHQHGNGLNGNRPVPCLADIEAHMRDLGVCIGAPGNGKRTPFLAAEQRIRDREV
jgi:hypothetical protein